MKTVVRLLLAALVALSALTAVNFSANPASAAETCLRQVSFTGKSSIGYSNNYERTLARSAPTTTICVKYAAAYGGYYIYSSSCSQVNYKIYSDDTIYLLRSAPTKFVSTTRAVACASNASFRWDRTWPVSDQYLCGLHAESRWDINPSTGSFTLSPGSYGSTAYGRFSSC